METADNTVVQKARAWVDNINTANGLASGWRLEMISKRYRYQKDAQTGVKKRIPVRIRRFARGLPLGLVHEAIRYLDSLAPYTGFIFNGERVTLSYRPTNTTWVRDDQHSVDGNASGTYTLVQDLIEEGSLDDFEAPSAGSCSEEVVTKWVWDATTVEDLPQWEQGVTYSIQAVNRKDDGTFDYALIRRRALTQHLPETVTECNEFETVYAETWDNVYGTPPDFRDETGVAITVPDSCTQPNGTTVSVQISENPDCTFKIVVQRRVAKSASSSSTCAKTKFEHTDATVARGQDSSLGEAPSASGGTTYTYRSEIRPDGKYDTTKEHKQELSVQSAVVEVRKTLRGAVRSTTSRNQARSVVPSNSSSMSIGEAFRSSVTPGGLYDNVHETVDKTPVGEVSFGCSKTSFEHVDRSTVNQVAKPGTHVPNAGGGTWTERQVSLTDYGTWDVQDTQHGEIPSSSAVVEVERTLRGVTRTVTDRNQSTALSGQKLALGESVRSSKTSGGLYDNVHRSIVPEDIGAIAETCTKTPTVHSHGTTENVVEKPNVEQAAAVNFERSATARLTEFGTWDVETRQTERQPFGPQVIASAENMLSASETSVFQSLVNAPHETAGTNEEVRVDASRNDYGSFDGRVVKETFKPWSGVVAAASSAGQSVTVEAGVNCPWPVARSAPAGGDVSVSASVNSHGTFDWNCRTVQYTPTTGQSYTKWKTEETSTVVTRRNTDLAPSVSGQFGTTSVSLDDTGTATTSSTIYTPKPVESGWITWTSTDRQPRNTYTYEHGVYIFKNVELSSVNSIAKSQSDKNIGIHATINQYGLYDGQASFTYLKDWELGGLNTSSQDGGIQEGVITVVDRDGRERRYKVKTYYGGGNEGSRAATQSNQMLVAGVSLQHGTYITGEA